MSPRLYIRVDATLATGLGHFMRCLAIAQRWRADYGPVTFVGSFDDALPPILDREALDAARLPGTHAEQRDVETALPLIDSDAAVVLDGYHFDYDYQHRLAEHARLLVVDDLGHLDRYAGMILLNASVNAAEIDYDEAPSRRLLGLRYAMLRREIIAARERAQRRDSSVSSVLVSFGGADAANDTLRILRALLADDATPGRVRVIVGPVNPHARSLRAFAAAHRSISIVEQPADMADELMRADFVIASAGTISAELAFLGKPCMLFAVADNQLGIGPAMEREGAAIFGGDIRDLDEHALAATLHAGLADDDSHETMRASGPRLVDGLGTMRICRELSGVMNV